MIRLACEWGGSGSRHRILPLIAFAAALHGSGAFSAPERSSQDETIAPPWDD
jgi:hypothetical protein